MDLATARGIGATSGNAAAVHAFRDAGFSVVGTLSGSLDLTATTPFHDTSFGALISPVFVRLSAGSGESSPDRFLRSGGLGCDVPERGESASGTATGDATRLPGDAGSLFRPQGCTGGPPSGSITFADSLSAAFPALPGGLILQAASADRHRTRGSQT